ncbi:MAG: S41 family peptidase [Candidatus Omnitrophota bacterium]
MKRFLYTPFLLLLVAAFSYAGTGYENGLGQRNFYQVSKYINDRFEESVDFADVFKTAWICLAHVMPVTSEIMAATYDISATSKEIRNFYASQIEKSIELAIKKRPDDATPTVLDLWNFAANGLVIGLKDPFSQFLPPKQHEELQRVLSGEPDEAKQFFGVGISVEWDTEGDLGVLVVAPLPGTPAERSGIKAGDIIVKVNGEILKDWEGSYKDKLEKAVAKITGEKGTEVTLTMKKPNSPETIDITLTREPINPELHITKEMLDGEVGRVRLMSFYANSEKELLETLRYLKTEGMKKLIFDLRFNPGGYLDQAVKVANIFLKEGDLITYTSGRKSTPRHFYAAPTPDDGFNQIPMAVLINEFSASASEVVTGALKDNQRAKIAGKKSFGKGSVQEVFNLDGDAGLRLTVAKYYTPSGECIHGKGIQPDIEVDPLTREEGEKLEEKDYTHISRLERMLEIDPQLKAAYQYLRGEIAAKDAD